jgi:hypothetical protein
VVEGALARRPRLRTLRLESLESRVMLSAAGDLPGSVRLDLVCDEFGIALLSDGSATVVSPGLAGVGAPGSVRVEGLLRSLRLIGGDLAGRVDVKGNLAELLVRRDLGVGGRLVAGAIVAVGVDLGGGGYLDGDERGAGGRLTSCVIAAYDAPSAGVPFGVVADTFGSITLAGARRTAPFADRDFRLRTV